MPTITFGQLNVYRNSSFSLAIAYITGLGMIFLLKQAIYKSDLLRRYDDLSYARIIRYIVLNPTAVADFRGSWGATVPGPALLATQKGPETKKN